MGDRANYNQDIIAATARDWNITEKTRRAKRCRTGFVLAENGECDFCGAVNGETCRLPVSQR